MIIGNSDLPRLSATEHLILDLLAGVGKVVISAGVFLWWAVPVLFVLWLILRPKGRTQTPATPTGESA